jgi:hypothetical protein
LEFGYRYGSQFLSTTLLTLNLIMDAAERERAVQHTTEELHDPATGAMAQQHQG